MSDYMAKVTNAPISESWHGHLLNHAFTRPSDTENVFGKRNPVGEHFFDR